MTTYVGLDLATVSGVAIIDSEAIEAVLFEVKGTPYEQLKKVLNFLDIQSIDKDNVKWSIEQIHTFLNAKTVRSLLERKGFVMWTLIGNGFEVEEVSPRVARYRFGFKGKKDAMAQMEPIIDSPLLTDNHVDAFAVALYHFSLSTSKISPSDFTFTVLERE
jgi:Holliday junction resolvasome RuvABC endonuclease subunit